MPNSVEHKVEMFQIGQERRRDGRPMWDHKITVADFFHNDAMSFEEKRDAIVHRLRTSAWLKGRDEFDNIVEAVDGLANAEDTGEFDGWWDEIYDIADAERVWITTN